MPLNIERWRTLSAISSRIFFLLDLVLCCAAGSGCARDARPYQVHGTVTIDGRPVAAGEMFFEPDAARGNSGPQGFAIIRDGKFDTTNLGRGVKGGPYSIRIAPFDGQASNSSPLGRRLAEDVRQTRDLAAADSEVNFEIISAK